MQYRPRLKIEPLDDRIVPATFGNAWPDAEHLTMSFAQDGTSIAGHASSLSAVSPVERLDVLRAFQAWAVRGNINIGLTGDSGQPFGTSGATQGDPRFGDIRLGGIPLYRDVLAITTPYGIYDPYAGDIVVNTAAGFGQLSGPDLRTVLLQEAGHALGIGNNPDPQSVMYEYYQGPRSGLAPMDVDAVTALYGARAHDENEGSNGNNTRGSARVYPGPLTADLTTGADVDYYKFTTGLFPGSLTVNLEAAGLSLLTARVELLDANGNVLASQATLDPTANNVTLTFTNVQSFHNYYVRVSKAQDNEFAIGSYRLTLSETTIVSPITGVVDNLLNETGLNDTLATAVTLLSGTSTVSQQTEFRASSRFGSSNDVDYYRITVPPATETAPINLIATLWGENGASLDGSLQVTNASGTILPTQLLVADGKTTTMQLTGLTAGQTYFLKLKSHMGSTGNYDLAADLSSDSVTFPCGAEGTVSAAIDNTFQIPQSGIVHFVLEAAGPAGTLDMTIERLDGTILGQLLVPTGRGRSIDLLLDAGLYRVTLRSMNASQPLAFRLALDGKTDPVGARATDPTATPEQPEGSMAPVEGDKADTPSRSNDVAWDPADDSDEAMWY